MRSNHSNEAQNPNTEPTEIKHHSYDPRQINSINLKHHFRLMKPLQMSEKTKIHKDIAQSLKLASSNAADSYDSSKDITLIILKNRIKEIAAISRAHDRLCNNNKIRKKVRLAHDPQIESSKEKLSHCLQIAKERLSEKGLIDILDPPTQMPELSTEPSQFKELKTKSKSLKRLPNNKEKTANMHSHRKLHVSKPMSTEYPKIATQTFTPTKPFGRSMRATQKLSSTIEKMLQPPDSPLDILKKHRKRVIDDTPKTPPSKEGSTLKLYQTVSTSFLKDFQSQNQHPTLDLEDILDSAKSKINLLTPSNSVYPSQSSNIKLTPKKQNMPGIQIEIERNRSSPYIFSTPENHILKEHDLSPSKTFGLPFSPEKGIQTSSSKTGFHIKSDIHSGHSGRSIVFDIEEHRNYKTEATPSRMKKQSQNNFRAQLLKNIETSRRQLQKSISKSRTEETRESFRDKSLKPASPQKDVEQLYNDFVNFYKKVKRRKRAKTEQRSEMLQDLHDTIKDVINQNYDDTPNVEKPNTDIVTTSIVRRYGYRDGKKYSRREQIDTSPIKRLTYVGGFEALVNQAALAKAESYLERVRSKKTTVVRVE